MTTDNWEEYNGYWIYSHDVGMPTNTEEQAEDMFKAHLLLEFLDYLKVLKYHRGYDGLYYDVEIKVRDGK